MFETALSHTPSGHVVVCLFVCLFVCFVLFLFCFFVFLTDHIF